VNEVSTNRFAGLSPRMRRRSRADFRPTKFTLALRLKSSAESLRPIRCSKHPTHRKRHLPAHWPRRHTLSLAMNQSPSDHPSPNNMPPNPAGRTVKIVLQSAHWIIVPHILG
jgi:hypothetical protein